ncbi:MAG: FAD-binding oxidoreductase, partial [Chloroflexota bacterium]|nr:FAD-binding oxidoreductase [Chloroflexota bacterium]
MSSAIVIGGGILGTATAWRLAEYSVDVTLLEAGSTTGDGASRTSFAWLNASNKPPQHYHQLNVDGMNHYRRLKRELGNPRWLHFDGHVEWDGSDGGPDLLRQKVERLRNWGYTAELLPINELDSLEPDLVAPANVDEFAYFPHEGYINPVDMIGDLAAHARAAGATIMTHTQVTELVTQADRVVGVMTTQGDRLLADTVVSCTGAVTPHLLDQLGMALPMAPTTGMVAVSSPSPVRLRSVHHDHLMNIRPDGSGRIMMRHYDFDDMVTPDTPELPIPAFMNQLLERVVTVLPGFASARIDSIRITTRPIPGDGLPVIGTIDGLEGLYLMVT